MAMVENASQETAVINGDGDQPESNGGNNLMAADSHGLYMKVHPFQAHGSNKQLHKLDDQPPVNDGGSSSSGGEVEVNGSDSGEEGLKRDMRELEEMFSKLNPMAEEFLPPSLANNGGFFFMNSGKGVSNGRRVYEFSIDFNQIFVCLYYFSPSIICVLCHNFVICVLCLWFP